VRRVIEGWGLEPASGELVVTELASNAVSHARTRFTVELVRRRTRVRIEVSDDSTEPPVERSLGLMAEAGRGLATLDMAAERWGFDVRDGGKSVWAEVLRQAS
jgi:two-component sensor histidine kinase